MLTKNKPYRDQGNLDNYEPCTKITDERHLFVVSVELGLVNQVIWFVIDENEQRTLVSIEFDFRRTDESNLFNRTVVSQTKPRHSE